MLSLKKCGEKALAPLFYFKHDFADFCYNYAKNIKFEAKKVSICSFENYALKCHIPAMHLILPTDFWQGKSEKVKMLGLRLSLVC